MSRSGRICFDISYTRTQPGNVGITRTVRRLLAAIAGMPDRPHGSCVPVAFHTNGFRHAAVTAAATARESDHGAARLYRRLTGGSVRRIVSAIIPLALLEFAWSLAGRWTFDSLSAGESPAVFGPGDWLVLADESWNYPAWRGARMARARGARVILVLYDLIPIRQPQYCAPLFARVFPEWLSRMLAQSDAVMCISQATQADLRAYCAQQNLACPPAAHFRLGADVPAAAGGGVRPALRDFLAGPAPCFAAIGTIEPRKNHAMLLAVFERLWAQGLDVRLFVAGRPHPDCQALVRRMQQHPQQGRHLLTLLDATDEEVALAYAECRALVFPSLAEGFGLPLVEARARGCRVIASDLPALLELADEGVSFVPQGNAEALEAMVRRHVESPPPQVGPARVFTWQDSAEQFVHAVEALLPAPPGAGR